MGNGHSILIEPVKFGFRDEGIEIVRSTYYSLSIRFQLINYHLVHSDHALGGFINALKKNLWRVEDKDTQGQFRHGSGGISGGINGGGGGGGMKEAHRTCRQVILICLL